MFQDNFREHVVMVTEDKTVVTTDDKETVAQFTLGGYSILTIYEHTLQPYTKLSSHTAKLTNAQGRRNVLKAGKKKNITIYTILCNCLKCPF